MFSFFEKHDFWTFLSRLEETWDRDETWDRSRRSRSGRQKSINSKTAQNPNLGPLSIRHLAKTGSLEFTDLQGTGRYEIVEKSFVF